MSKTLPGKSKTALLLKKKTVLLESILFAMNDLFRVFKYPYKILYQYRDTKIYINRGSTSYYAVACSTSSEI